MNHHQPFGHYEWGGGVGMEVLVFLQNSVPVYASSTHPPTLPLTSFTTATSIHPFIKTLPSFKHSYSTTSLPPTSPNTTINHDRPHKIRFIHLHPTRRPSKLQCTPRRQEDAEPLPEPRATAAKADMGTAEVDGQVV